jgi:hypothetical protein
MAKLRDGNLDATWVEASLTPAGKATILSIAVAFGLLAAFGHYTHRGYIGVVGSADALRFMGHGFHLRPPWQRVTSYPLQCREVRVEIFDEGPEAKIHFDGVFFMSICRDSVASLHRAYRGAYVERVISPMLAKFLREYGEGYGLWENDVGPQKVTSAILDYLGPEAGRYGINVAQMWLRSFEVERTSGTF